MEEQQNTFDNAEYYINRELSWLEFNNRVLEEGQEENTPLLERVRFLAIVASNLDEFFMVRVAGLKKQLAAGLTKQCPAGLTPEQQLDMIYKKVHKMVEEQYRCFNETLKPLFAKHRITFLCPDELSFEQLTFLEEYFNREIYPVLTPMAIDASHPFPFLQSTTLNMIFSFAKQLGSSGSTYAIVQVPDVLPRLIRLPATKDEYTFVYLEEAIAKYFDVIYPDQELLEAIPFRVIRDSDLAIHEEESYDLMRDIEAELRNRRRGAAVRLAISSDVSDAVLALLKNNLDLDDEDVYKINGPLNLKDFIGFPAKVDISALKEPPMPPRPISSIAEDADLYDAIKARDIFLHHPFHSFAYVINLIERASVDPDVLAIKMTLYRVSGDSPIVKALITAAEKGKQVTALVELKARFDEERNIEWAKKLEMAGAHVIYGLVGLKTHCKVCLIIRREPEGIRRYIHMSTGNYNDATARLYTDIGMMTCDEETGIDISALFNVLTGYSNPPNWYKIEVAPTGLRSKLIHLIQREARRSTKNQPGRIIAKMNSLVDQEIISHLYRASRDGVQIDLIVRGICCLRPGLPKISKNIRVISIVDRFLEHSRIFYFKNGGNEELYLSSADWMPRNLDRRVELFFPVEDKTVRKEVFEVLTAALDDTVKARVLQPDGTYALVSSKKKKPVRSQEALYRSACQAVEAQERKKKRIFIPLKGQKETIR
jgi:polyphosphate kinase